MAAAGSSSSRKPMSDVPKMGSSDSASSQAMQYLQYSEVGGDLAKKLNPTVDPTFEESCQLGELHFSILDELEKPENQISLGQAKQLLDEIDRDKPQMDNLLSSPMQVDALKTLLKAALVKRTRAQELLNQVVNNLRQSLGQSLDVFQEANFEKLVHHDIDSALFEIKIIASAERHEEEVAAAAGSSDPSASGPAGRTSFDSRPGRAGTDEAKENESESSKGSSAALSLIDPEKSREEPAPIQLPEELKQQVWDVFKRFAQAVDMNGFTQVLFETSAKIKQVLEKITQEFDSLCDSKEDRSSEDFKQKKANFFVATIKSIFEEGQRKNKLDKTDLEKVNIRFALFHILISYLHESADILEITCVTVATKAMQQNIAGLPKGYIILTDLAKDYMDLKEAWGCGLAGFIAAIINVWKLPNSLDLKALNKFFLEDRTDFEALFNDFFVEKRLTNFNIEECCKVLSSFLSQICKYKKNIALSQDRLRELELARDKAVMKLEKAIKEWENDDIWSQIQIRPIEEIEKEINRLNIQIDDVKEEIESSKKWLKIINCTKSKLINTIADRLCKSSLDQFREQSLELAEQIILREVKTRHKIKYLNYRIRVLEKDTAEDPKRESIRRKKILGIKEDLEENERKLEEIYELETAFTDIVKQDSERLQIWKWAQALAKLNLVLKICPSLSEKVKASSNRGEEDKELEIENLRVIEESAKKSQKNAVSYHRKKPAFLLSEKSQFGHWLHSNLRPFDDQGYAVIGCSERYLEHVLDEASYYEAFDSYFNELKLGKEDRFKEKQKKPFSSKVLSKIKKPERVSIHEPKGSKLASAAVAAAVSVAAVPVVAAAAAVPPPPPPAGRPSSPLPLPKPVVKKKEEPEAKVSERKPEAATGASFAHPIPASGTPSRGAPKAAAETKAAAGAPPPAALPPLRVPTAPPSPKSEPRSSSFIARGENPKRDLTKFSEMLLVNLITKEKSEFPIESFKIVYEAYQRESEKVGHSEGEVIFDCKKPEDAQRALTKKELLPSPKAITRYDIVLAPRSQSSPTTNPGVASGPVSSSPEERAKTSGAQRSGMDWFSPEKPHQYTMQYHVDSDRFVLDRGLTEEFSLLEASFRIMFKRYKNVDLRGYRDDESFCVKVPHDGTIYQLTRRQAAYLAARAAGFKEDEIILKPAPRAIQFFARPDATSCVLPKQAALLLPNGESTIDKVLEHFTKGSGLPGTSALPPPISVL